MKDQYKTKKQLIEELEVLRNQLAKPKKTEANGKRAEKTLRESQERFKIAAQSTSDLIWDWDIPTGRLQWFGAIDEFLGYAPGKFPRTIEAWEKVIHPDNHDRVMAALDHHLKEQAPYNEEYRVRRKDGTYRYWTDRGTVLRDSGGNPLKMVGACTDITERKWAEKELHESKKFLQDIFDGIQDGISVLDRNLTITQFNKWIEKIHHKDMPLIGKKCYEVYQKRKTVCPWCPSAKALSTGKVHVEDVWVPFDDGSFWWCELSAYPLRDENDDVVGVIEHVKDITERKQTEEKLLESESRYRTLFDSASDAIFILDPTTAQFLDVNRVACERLDYSREELVQMTAPDIDSPEYAPLVRERIETLRQLGHVFFETTHVRRDGTIIPTELSSRIITYAGKPAVLSIARDITKRKQAEARAEHLKFVLLAIRGVNQLITREKDRDRLIQDACDKLIETRGYDNVWIALIDESGKVVATVEAGLGKSFLPLVEQLGRSEPPHCMRMALTQAGALIIEDPFATCADCPLSNGYGGRRAMATRLEHDGKIYGLMTVSVSGDYVADEEEQTLFAEVAEDIAFALYSIELEEKRKQAEAAVRESKERYRAVIESQIDLISRYLPDTTLTFVNDAYCQFYGKTREELIGHSFLSMVAPEFHELVLKETENLTKNPRSIEGEYLNYRQDGEECWIQWVVQGIGGENGRVVELQAVGRDITERKQTEEALRQSEERFRLAFENANTGVCLVDLDGNLTRVNNKMCEIFGYTKEELEHMTVNNIAHPEDIYKSPKFIQKTLRGETDRGMFEKRYIHKKGHVVTCEVSSSLVRNTEGSPLYFISHVHDITARKQVEEALKERQETINAIIETSQDWIWAIDRHGVHTYSNPAIEKILGYRTEEIIGSVSLDLMHEDDKKMVEPILQECEEKRCGWNNLLLRWRHKNGTYRYLESNAVPILNSKGDLIGFRGGDRDITERKQAEEALRQSEERYRTILEDIEDGYFEVDLAGHSTFINDSLCKIHGYPREELLGVDYRQFVDKENAQKMFEAFNRIYRTGEPYKVFDYELIRKDGTKRQVEVSASLKKDPSGNPIGFRGITRDVTEHKQAEELLQKEREISLSILENAPYGVALIDKGGQYIYINPEFTNITGYTLQDIPTGKDWFQKAFPDPKHRERMIQVWKEDRLKGSMMNRELSVTCKDGTIREIEIRSTFLGDGRAVIVLHDITEKKRAEERMESLQEQLRQSQKMEAIGRLAGGIAHDFNNLLTIIKGYSQLSLIELKEDTPLKGNIEHIHTATDRAADLVRQLLAFSRRQILEMKVLDLNTTLANLHNMLRRLIGEDIELTTVLAKDLGRVKTDLGWIEQAIMNLVVNARDAMPSGGKLTIETGNADLDEAYVGGHVGVKPGRYVMLSVSDTGVGMTPEVRERLFEPFFSTKEKDKGTGLGLSTVYGIVKQSGGDIWVYSEPGKGSTFKIYLPRVDEPLEQPREKILGDELLRGSETILLVEDEEEVRKLAVRVLERQGYKVLAARDGDEALLICERHQDPIHLMLTDVVMPGMNGHEVAKRLESFHPEMKVLYMSGYTDNAIVLHGVLVEGVNYIQKPFTVDALTKKVREVLEQ